MATCARIGTMALAILLLAACATFKLPGRLLETEVAQILSNIDRTHPQESLYREYEYVRENVRENMYLQFDRVSEDNVIYGWRTCTNCSSWTREKMAAIYDGSYLYITTGHHEDFFLSAPEPKPMHSRPHWTWSTVDKFQVEGRKLVQLSQFRKCVHKWPNVEEWSSAPRITFNEVDCRYAGEELYQRVWVATIDNTLVGKSDSIVGSENETVKERLKTLEQLYRDGAINESEYNKKRRDILDEL